MKLIEVLKQRGLSQRELAFRSGLAVALVNGYCRGAGITRRNAERIAATLEMTPVDLWGEAFEKFRKVGGQ